MAEINHDEKKRRLNSYLDQRDYEFDAYLQDYSTRNPPPEKKDVFTRHPQLSLKFWLAISAGICAVGASGMRVYDIIYRVAVNSGASPQFATIESIFALGAVNIGLVALAFTSAYVKRKVSQQSLTIGVFVAAAISLVAGFGQSFNGLMNSGAGELLQSTTLAIDWVLAVSLALITALEWVSGDMAGVEMVTYEMKKESYHFELDKETKREDQRYEVEYKDWLKIARQQFGNWKMQYVNWEKSNFGNTSFAQTPSFAVETDEVPDYSHKSSTQFRKQDGRTSVEQENNVSELPEEVSRAISNSASKEFILETINTIYQETNQIPGVTHICKSMALAELPKKYRNNEFVSEYVKSKKGYVSKVRKEWMLKNGLQGN